MKNTLALFLKDRFDFVTYDPTHILLTQNVY